MEREIKTIGLQMAGLVLAAVALCIWQSDFIWHAIQYNPYINTAILVTTAGGLAFAFLCLTQALNDCRVLAAMQEMYEDSRQSDGEDLYARHARYLQPATTFGKPNVLSSAYTFMREEVARCGKISIQAESFDLLISRAEQKAGEQRSLLTYISGLLVFLGLVGTFLGLLIMVGSIAGILSGLQASANDGAEGFTKLLGDLQKPLSGMATGFAASLLGLAGSLIVGLVARMSDQATRIVRRAFEAWLGAVAQSQNMETLGPATRGDLTPRATELIAKIVSDYSRTVRGRDASSEIFAKLLESGRETSRAISSASLLLERLTDEQAFLRQGLSQLRSVAGSIEKLEAAVSRADSRGSETFEAVADRICRSVERLEASQGELLQSLTQQQNELVNAVTHSVIKVGESTSATTEALRHAHLQTEMTRSLTQKSIMTDLMQVVKMSAERQTAAIEGLKLSLTDVLRVDRAEMEGARRLAEQSLASELAQQLAAMAERQNITLEAMQSQATAGIAAQQRASEVRDMALRDVLSSIATRVVQSTEAMVAAQIGQTAEFRALAQAQLDQVARGRDYPEFASHFEDLIQGLSDVMSAQRPATGHVLDDNAATQLLAKIERSLDRGFDEINQSLAAVTTMAVASAAFSSEPSHATMADADKDDAAPPARLSSRQLRDYVDRSQQDAAE